MADVFREVDEDLRKARLARVWRLFAPYVISVAILVVVGVAGYKGWEAWKLSQAGEASDIYFEAIDKIEEEDFEEAHKLLASLEDGPAGYPIVALMRSATEYGLKDEMEKAVEIYDKLIANNAIPVLYRELAAIRAAYLLLDGEDMAEVRQRVNGMTGDENPWRHLVWEILAMAEWKAGEGETAVSWMDRITEDESSPRGINSRAKSMKRLMESEGFISEVDKKKEEEENNSS